MDAAPVDYEEDTAEACADDDDSDSWVTEEDEDDLEADAVPLVKTDAAAKEAEDAAEEETEDAAAKEAEDAAEEDTEDAAAEEADVDISDIQVACLDEGVIEEAAEDNNEVSLGKYWTDFQHLELISSFRQMTDRYTPGLACYPRNQERSDPTLPSNEVVIEEAEDNKEEIGPDPLKQEESDESDWDPPVNPHPVYRISRDPKKNTSWTATKVI